MGDTTTNLSKEPPVKPKIRGIQFDRVSPKHQEQLRVIVEAVKNDPDLDLQIRDGYVNIYYKGGSLLKISSFRGRQINFSFDPSYYKRKGKDEWEVDAAWLKEIPRDASSWVKCFPKLKNVMNDWFKDGNNKTERELQHKLASESTRNPSSHWIILDIEYAVWLHGERNRDKRTAGRRLCRFDMIALERTELHAAGPLTVYLIEFKQGLGAVDGKAGVAEHAEDLKQFISGGNDKDARRAFKESVRNILREKIELGLLPGVAAPQENVDIEFKALFLVQGVENLQKVADLENAANKVLGEYGASPLFRNSLN